MTIPCATRLLAGVALGFVAMSCAVQVSDNGDEPAQGTTTEQSHPSANPPGNGGGTDCSPVPGFDAEGHIYVKAYICPDPVVQPPDPVQATRPPRAESPLEGRLTLPRDARISPVH